MVITVIELHSNLVGGIEKGRTVSVEYSYQTIHTKGVRPVQKNIIGTQDMTSTQGYAMLDEIPKNRSTTAVADGPRSGN